MADKLITDAAVITALRGELDPVYDAQYAPRLTHKAGRYYAVPPGVIGATVLTVGRTYAVPLAVGATRTIDRLGVSVTVAGSAGAVIRLGIYDDDDGLPGSLVLDAGTVDATTTGNKEVTLSQAVSGRVWLVASPQVAISTFRTVAAHHDEVSATDLTNLFVGAAACYQDATASGALPSSFSTGGAPRTVAPLIAYRLSA